jgi:hypothetical protein
MAHTGRAFRAWAHAGVFCLASWTLIEGRAHAEAAVAHFDIGTCSDEIALGPSGGELPANHPRIVLFGLSTPYLARRDTGVRVRASVSTSTLGTVLRLEEPLEVGATYELGRDECPGPRILAIYTAVEALPAPSAFGTLSVSPLYAYYPRPGSRERVHFVDATLVPDGSMTPWLDAYDWWLDAGVVESPRRSLRTGLTVNHNVRCLRGSTGFASLTGRASVTPGPADLTTPTFTPSFVCDDAIVLDIDTRRPLTAEEIAELERLATIDAAVPDAFVSIDGGSAAMPTEPDTNPNCSAHLAREGTGSLCLVLFAFAFSAVRRAARVSGARRRGACGRRRARCASSA